MDITGYIPALLTATAAMLTASSATAAESGAWSLHLPFDQTVTHMAETPDRVYFMGRSMLYHPSIEPHNHPWGTIFHYDKSTGGIGCLDRLGLPDGACALDMAYSAGGGLLAVVYDSLDIDLVYDDGHTVNAPGLAARLRPGAIAVTDITFDHGGREAFVSTSRGYAVFDTATGRMTEYREYDREVASAAPMGEYILLVCGGELLYAPRQSARHSLSEYARAECGDMVRLLPLSDSLCGFVRIFSNSPRICLAAPDGNGGLDLTLDMFSTGTVYRCENRDGYSLQYSTQIAQLNRDGTWRRTAREEDMTSVIATSWDGSDVWSAAARRGIWCRHLEDGVWSETVSPIMPDAPSMLHSTHLTWHPDYGVLANSHAVTVEFPNGGIANPVLLSARRDGSWTRLGLPYTYPEMAGVLYNPHGAEPDPLAPHHIYMGSSRHGLLRLDTSDPKGLMHFSHPSDPSAALEGFVPFCGDQETWNICMVSTPRFDNEGYMWFVQSDIDAASEDWLKLYCWSPENRLATRDADSYRPMTSMTVHGAGASSYAEVYPLRHPSNRNLLILAPNTYRYKMVVYDHNGTPEDPSDDRMALVWNLYDQDGGLMPDTRLPHLFEDPETGLVWLPAEFGPMVVNPRTLLADPTRARRPGATDDEGMTRYLMEGQVLTDIVADGANNKWITTLRNGVTCVSPDGTRILAHFTTDNSPLPSNTVYTACYDPAANSMMLATAAGLAEYRLDSVTRAPQRRNAVASPDVVTPGFDGWVTVSGAGDDPLEVTDSGGNTVCRLGTPDNGLIQWDVRDSQNNPVPPGVYYVSVCGDYDAARLVRITVLR